MFALMWVISDIHRVLWVNADPVDVRNDSQQDTRSQAIHCWLERNDNSKTSAELYKSN